MWYELAELTLYYPLTKSRDMYTSLPAEAGSRASSYQPENGFCTARRIRLAKPAGWVLLLLTLELFNADIF